MACSLILRAQDEIGEKLVQPDNKIHHHFQLFKVDQRMADGLQARLIRGGQDGIDAMAKMPEFIKNGQGIREAELTILSMPGEKMEANSSDKKIEYMRTGDKVFDVADGLQVELLTTRKLNAKQAELRIIATYARKLDDGVRIHNLRTAMLQTMNEPVLVARWQQKD